MTCKPFLPFTGGLPQFTSENQNIYTLTIACELPCLFIQMPPPLLSTFPKFIFPRYDCKIPKKEMCFSTSPIEYHLQEIKKNHNKYGSSVQRCFKIFKYMRQKFIISSDLRFVSNILSYPAIIHARSSILSPTATGLESCFLCL